MGMKQISNALEHLINYRFSVTETKAIICKYYFMGKTSQLKLRLRPIGEAMKQMRNSLNCENIEINSFESAFLYNPTLHSNLQKHFLPQSIVRSDLHRNICNRFSQRNTCNTEFQHPVHPCRWYSNTQRLFFWSEKRSLDALKCMQLMKPQCKAIFHLFLTTFFGVIGLIICKQQKSQKKWGFPLFYRSKEDFKC